MGRGGDPKPHPQNSSVSSVFHCRVYDPSPCQSGSRGRQACLFRGVEMEGVHYMGLFGFFLSDSLKLYLVQI